MTRSSRPPLSKTLRSGSAVGKVAIGFRIFAGFFIGLATSVGARVLLCPDVEAARPTVSAAPAKPVEPPSSVTERMRMARSILAAVVEGDGRWTEEQRLALKKEVELLPEEQAREIVHEMVHAIHTGRLRPE